MWTSKRYIYPTKEAYRFHFYEPPAVNQTQQEAKRVSDIVSWNKYRPNRTTRELQQVKSERTDFDHQMAPENVRKDAPFGTNDTPAITLKIIGGRQVPVIEKNPTYNPEYMGSRILALQPIADKPNHLDPRTFGDIPGGYYKKDVQLEVGDTMPTLLTHRRPDSKDIVRGQYRALPPIQANRTRNDMSTVFEAEAWTSNKNPRLADNTEYKQNFYSGKDFNVMDAFQPVGQKEHHYVSETETKGLLMLVPRNVLLPVDPIKLTREQEIVLCKLIVNELNRFDPKELRDIYVECSQYDKELRGFCGVEILDNCLRKHKVFLSDTLRIISAQFVDPNYPGKINYEKVISFIGLAIQLNEKGQLSSGKQPKYNVQNEESYQTGSIYRDREVAKLLRMVEQELSKSTYKLDWTRWKNAFYERDRDHIETLSAAQIKDICYDQKLPLSDSLINHILTLCEDNNRDGQYRWSTFLEFLSRVRPSNKGLPIPQRELSPRRDVSPRREENNADVRNTERDTNRRDNNYYEGNNRGGGSYRSADGPPTNRPGREEQIRQLSRQLKELESKFEITKEGLTSNDLPWLDRYLKMAQALYNSDISSKGSLPRKDVMDIVNQYNNAFDLKLDMTRANMLAIAPENLDKSGNIVLRSFLANLSADRISYKA